MEAYATDNHPPRAFECYIGTRMPDHQRPLPRWRHDRDDLPTMPRPTNSAQRDTQAAEAETARHPTSGQPLSPEAQRALQEAAERRAAATGEAKARPIEKDGPKGPEPTRYGDWEKGGIASDF